MHKIKLSNDIILPPDIVTQAVAILAKRRSGKSYTMRRLVEQLFKADQQIAIVDPKGDQWGIRSSADGESPGLPILILGGEHGDLPLEVTAGETIANLVVKEHVSVLLDISLFRKHEVATFMTGFLENLYRLKAQEQYRTPIMLVIDEADAIAPQKPQKGEERMLGAANDIVRRGGQRGIGCTLVTQRSAVLNKNVLTQCEMLIVLRTIAPQDLAAMKAWVDVHGTDEEGKTLMESLPSLPIGDAWFWSPGWPTADGIFKRTHVLPIETFDSGATPKVGEKKIVPKNLADIDLDSLKSQMAATIEKAQNEDPKILRKRIFELEKQVKDAASRSATPKTNTAMDTFNSPVGVSQWREYGKKYEYWGYFERQIMEARDKDWSPIVKGWKSLFYKLKEGLERLSQVGEFPIDTPRSDVTFVNVKPDIEVRKGMAITSNMVEIERENGDIIANGIKIGSEGAVVKEFNSPSAPQKKVLDAIAWLRTIGVEEPVKGQVAIVARYKAHSGSFRNLCSELKGAGLVDYPVPGTITLTARGEEFADTEMGSKGEVHERVYSMLTNSEAKILKALIEVYPEALSNEELVSASGAESFSGSFRNNKSRLSTYGLIEYPKPNYSRAVDFLFP